jgi:hypothetical protein
MKVLMSKYTKATFIDVGNYLDNTLLPPNANKNIPPSVGSIYKKLKAFIIQAGRYQHPINRQHQQ